MPGKNLQKSSQTRVFTIEDRAGPANVARYEFLARALGLSWDQGAITPIRIPDPEQYGRFITVDSIKAQEGLPTISLESHLTRDRSEFLKLARKGCTFDVQLHTGVCFDPRDFNGGWEKIYVLEGANINTYSTNDLGALDGAQNVPVMETIPLAGLDYYEIMRIFGSEIAAAEVVQKVIGVTICDSKQCGECGLPSNGCQKIFAVTLSHGGSPGLPAKVIYTPDAGTVIGTSAVTSLAANQDPTGIACVGTNLVVVSKEGLSINYANIADVINGVGVWAKTVVGLVAAKGPNKIFSLGRTFTWLVGDGGYIYFSADVISGVTVQQAGGLTIQNLNDIHGSDELHLAAVGVSNAVLKTTDGGITWASVTGPAPGVALNSVYMRSANEWLVGGADGNLYFTRDAGNSWVVKGFSGSGTGSINDIEFATPTVGYMAHTTAAGAGRVFRSIDGGFSWYVLPEQAGLAIPANKGISALAACSEDPNFAFAAGLGNNSVDGILIKIAP